MRRMIDNYNVEVDHYKRECSRKSSQQHSSLEEVVSSDPKLIIWTRGLKDHAEKGRNH